MQKTIKYPKESWIFDIKGNSRWKRLSRRSSPKKIPKCTILREKDFRRCFGFLNLHFEEANELKQTLIRDIRFLQSFQLMDYSLLVGIREYNSQPVQLYELVSKDSKYVYSISIIDILSCYQFRSISDIQVDVEMKLEQINAGCDRYTDRMLSKIEEMVPLGNTIQG